MVIVCVFVSCISYVSVLRFSRQKNILHDFHGRESNAIWPHVRKFLVTLRQPVQEVEYK